MASDDDIDRRLADQMRELPLPPGLEERIAAAVHDQLKRRAATPRRRRGRLLALAIAGLILAGATTATGFWILGGDGDGSTVPAGPEARASIAESGVLARAAWLGQPGGSPHLQETRPNRSLIYPLGTTYASALDRLLRSVVERGLLPSDATLGAPLARGVVWAPGSALVHPRLDLRAPWGYEVPAGLIRTPSFRLSGRVPAAEASAIMSALIGRRATGNPLPKGAQVGVPKLLPCQVQRLGERNLPCRLRPPATTSD